MPATAALQKPGTTRTLQSGKDGGLVRRTVLPGGLRVVTEAMPGVRSAAIGVWVGVGSRDEAPDAVGRLALPRAPALQGHPHPRSALDISVALDEVGGEFNAFTAKEYTCFHARVLDQDLPLAVDVLGDMVTSSLITAEDVEAEREVILDEIAMHDDDPDDVVHNLWAAQAWGSSPLGRPIAGTAESIRALSRAQIARYYRSRYAPSTWSWRSPATSTTPPSYARSARRSPAAASWPTPACARRRPAAPATAAAARRGRAQPARSSRSTWCSAWTRWCAPTSAATRSACSTPPLGGGTSSRLFQEIREQRGLAYSVYSYAAHYADAGAFAVAVGLPARRVGEVLSVVRAELDRFASARHQCPRSSSGARASCAAGWC